jgi:amino acid transporter
MWGPPLLAYTVYALYFVLTYTTTTNAMHFANQVIIAATNDKTIHDERVLRLIAIITLSFLCLVMYFSTATGRRLIRYSAYAKIGLMLAIVVAGGIKAKQVRAADLSRSFNSSQTSAAAALLQIFFAFLGWENAILVRL